MNTLNVALGLLALLCAALAMRSTRLLHSALWLAGASAALAALLYALGAREVAVIELSVGAGLVTVVFVFAIAVAGNGMAGAPPVVPRPLAWAAIALLLAVLAGAVLPLGISPADGADGAFAQTFWHQRELDVIVQIVLIFAAAVGMLGLLAEPRTQPRRRETPAAASLPEKARP